MPYILLAFDGALTEEQIKNNLKIFNGSNTELTIDWMTNNSEFNPNADVSATTIGDMKKVNDDGKKYRLALLRLKDGGKYIIDAGELTFTDEKTFSVKPFEKLALTLNANQISGQVKHAMDNTPYVIRTYFSDKEGGADYMISEQEIGDTANIELFVPSSGAIAPTGEYYVTAFLMTKKQADINGDGKVEEALIAIDNQAFNEKVSYTNINEPSAPTDVTLQTLGNEVMRAQWNAAANADGYAVRIYEEQNNTWTDTGFGYALDKGTTAVDMALTVGGNGVRINENGSSAESVPAENLLPDKTYKIGVRAYKNSENGKYYSKEIESVGEFLPKYTPLDITLSMNGSVCTPDENGVYHAYVGGGDNTLTVSEANGNAAFKLTRMDTNAEIPHGNSENTFSIPEFEGSLMFKIDGISGKDVTSVFLLVNMDKEPPVLTLSSDIFYADKETGNYTITGMSDAGSRIIYDDNEEVVAGSDGKFTVSGTLNGSETSILIMLYAQDAAANASTPQKALVTRKKSTSVTVAGSYAEITGSGEYTDSETVSVSAGTRDGYIFAGWTSDSNITFADSSSADTTFVMPNTDVTVKANWRKTTSGGSLGGVPYFTVLFDTNGGSRLQSKSVAENSIIAEPAAPTKDGFEFAGWYTDKELKTAYDFSKKITKNLTLYAAWNEKSDTAAWDNPFTDIKESDWFFKNVEYAAQNNLMSGLTRTSFGPNEYLTRAMLVTVLWRAEGKPQANFVLPFDDVAEDAYYAEAVRWAASVSIVNGVAENKFAPDDNITREQIAAIIFRYAKYKGAEISKDQSVKLDYADVGEISDYAAQAILYCKHKGIIMGKDNNNFAPKDNASRAETAAILQRYLEMK